MKNIDLSKGAAITPCFAALCNNSIVKHDPFHIHGIADYEIIEFIPGKFHPDFLKFIGN